MAVDLDRVRNYLGVQPGNPPVLDEVLADALEAAVQRIVARCMPLGDPAQWPDVVDQAVTMLAARLYRRRFSVSGFEGFADIGVARVPTLDPDIEDLLIRHLSYDFA